MTGHYYYNLSPRLHFLLKCCRHMDELEYPPNQQGVTFPMIPMSWIWSSQVLSYITILWCGTCDARVWLLSKTDLRVSSVQYGLPSPAERSFTPESCRSLVLRSRSLRLEEFELRTEARASQHLSDQRQPFSLNTNKQNMFGTVI